METFKITLINVIITLLFILPGFILGKTKKIPGHHLSSISSLLVYVCMPLMIISSFIQMKEFRVDDFIQMITFFFVSLLVQILFFAILFLILRKKFEEPKYRLFSIGSCLGNVGFFGLPLIKASLAQYPVAACFSCVYVCSMNILVFTLGTFCITSDKSYISLKKAFINPPTIGLIIAIILYCTNSYKYLNQELINAIDLMGKMTTPLCMIILGSRLANSNFKSLFDNWFLYLNILTKMIIFPISAYFLVRYIPILSYEFKASMLILSAAPCASMVLNLAEIKHQEEELSANIVLVTTLFSVITIPLVTLFLNI